jgi:hypothetical protein
MNKILLSPSQDDSYDVFPELDGKLEFNGINDRLGYYFNEYSSEQLRKFSFKDIRSLV